MQSLYVLKTPPSNRQTVTHLGITKNDQSFVFAFNHIEHARMANTSITTKSNFDIVPRRIINEVCTLVDLKIYIESVSDQINLFEVHKTNMAELLTIPIVNNIGVVIALD